MQSVAHFMLVGSGIALLLLSVYWLVRYQRWRWVVFGILGSAVALGLSGVLPGLFASDDGGIVPMGVPKHTDIPAMAYVWQYTSMLAGMLAQSLHERFSRSERERPTFDVGVFVAPIFVSPIVFLPLVQAIGAESASGSSLVLVCMVAFENGFFFKHYLDQKSGKLDRKRPRPAAA